MGVPFGRYELLTRLTAGGMGEVFLARARDGGEGGTVFVLKRVLPHLAADEELRELFLHEARIAAQLHHPNIAQVFELGDVDGQWFITMEYVPGRDLRSVAGAARARRQPVPFPLACRIVADAAAALDHAHHARDAQGRALHVVHRDVSPQNLVVGLDGVVKLIDFGVARAASRLPQTERALQGTYAHLAPEQAATGEADHRSDQFSLGTVFWELLTGRRLFPGDDDAATLRLVTECRIERPATVRPEVPPALDRLAARMLARAPGDRFPDCGEVRLALEEHLQATQALATTAHLAEWMRDLFPEGDAPGEEHLAAVRRPSSGAAVEPASAPLPDLPTAPSSLVGRAGELAALRELIARERLLTLAGPEGVGKTRLALELARSLPRACFADLAEAADLEAACAATARALGVALPTEGPAEAAVAAALAARAPSLLVLDAVEGRLPLAQRLLEGWRAAAERTAILMTSTEALRLPGEHVFEVPGLAEGAQLFLERARAARPGWTPSDAELAAVEELARTLDGLPLAIELVAAAAAFPAAEELRAGARGPSGAASLRGVVAWASSLLSPPERALLTQLAVFPGGFGIDAVEAVADLSAFPAAPWALDLLQALRERALVSAGDAPWGRGELRFSLPRSVREHALERLRSAGPDAEEGARGRLAAFQLAQGRG